MNNTRTLISSSLVSLIIILLGMFMLCMSQAPQITFDEPLVEGGGVASDSTSDEDAELFSMLNDSDDNQSITEDNGDATSSDEDFLNLLNEDEQNTSSDESSTSSDPATDTSDEGMDDILKMLELDDSSDVDSGDKVSDSEGLEELLADDDSETADPAKTRAEDSTTPPTTEAPSSQAVGSTDQLSKEVESLETMLSDKTAQAENLQNEIKTYDQKISEYQRSGSASRSSDAPVQPVSGTRQRSTSESNFQYESDNGYFDGNYEASYNAALDAYRSKDYQQAVNTFFQLLQQNPEHELADNCQYWLGECRFAQGKYYQAIVEFNKVFAHDSPDKQDDAQLMLGLAYMKLGEMTSARNEFDWLVSCYNSSEYVSTANRYLGQF